MDPSISTHVDLTDELLAKYSDESYSEQLDEDLDRPIYIPPGIYEGRLIEWGKTYNPMFKKYSLEMVFSIGNERLRDWFNIELSDSDTQIKAGWKSDLVRMYQECFNERRQRRDRMAPNKFMGKTLKLMVVSIDKDSNKNSLAEINHYSRVKKILSILGTDVAY